MSVTPSNPVSPATSPGNTASYSSYAPSPIRFRSRHLLATIYNHYSAAMSERGWITPPINFGATPLTLLDYQPDERTEPIKKNTAIVTLGDFTADADEEMGTRGGGLRSALYPVFIDVFMEEQALSLAICDEIRDIYTDQWIPLINQIDGAQVPAADIEITRVLGPERGAVGPEAFRRYWRTMRLDCKLYFNT